MKTQKAVLITIRNVLVTIVALLILMSNGTAKSDTIELRADSWYPYNGDPQSDKPGYMVEVAKQIFSAAGYSVNYQISPWARSIELGEAGKIDGIIGAVKDEAPTFIFPSEPLGVTHSIFFTLSNSTWTFSGIDSLKNISLGYILDYSYGTTLDQYIESNSKNSSLLQGLGGQTPLEQNIKKLLLNRVQAVVSEPEVFTATIQQLGLDKTQFRQAGPAQEKQELFIAFSPKRESSKVYAKLLSDGIEQLRKSGELKKILDRYEIRDWK